MSDLLVFETLETILAQWQQAGAAASLDPYVKAASSLGQADRYAKFERLWQTHAVSDEQVFHALAMAVLSGDAAAPDQIVLFMVLPWLRDRLALGRAIERNLGTWTGKPTDVALRPAHVRTLAGQCIHPGPLDAAKAEAVLILYALCGAPWRNARGHTPSAFMGEYQRSPHHQALLEDALRFWDGPELVPALASHLQALAGQRQMGEILDRLQFITWILEWSGKRLPDLRQELRCAVGAVVVAAIPTSVAAIPTSVAAIPPSVAPQNTFACMLLNSYETLCTALGIEVSSPQAWYRAIADLIEGPFGGQTLLRAAWAEDIAGSLCSKRPGWHLVPQLYRQWLGSEDPRSEIAKTLATVFGQVHHDLVSPLSAMMWSMLEATIRDFAVDIALLARQYLQTCRIVARESPDLCRILLLARILDAGGPAQKLFRLLLEGGGPTLPWHRALAEVARTMPPRLVAEHEAVGLLLWELLLAPRRREVSLMARLERLYNRARLGGAGPDHLAAVARAMGMLGDPRAGPV